MTRRKIRETIFKILFRVEFNPLEEMDEQIQFALEELRGEPETEEVLENAEEEAALEETEEMIYIREKLEAILQNLTALDDMIQKASESWKLNRMGKAELGILRLATYEIIFEEEVPNKVAINEAVELAKRYCDEEAKGFVNALLGKIEHQNRGASE